MLSVYPPMTPKAVTALSYKHPIIVYDGVCILCNRFVQWLIKRDRDHRFLFVAQQTVAGDMSPEQEDTVVMVHQGKRYFLSDVSLEACKLLPAPWPMLAILRVIPKQWRDSVYRWVASNRYRWFGRSATCILPPAESRSRFIGL